MNPLLPQSELMSLMGNERFVRRANDDDVFWVSDTPRREPEEACHNLEKRLFAQGFTVATTDTALWRIDLTEDRWGVMLDHVAPMLPVALPQMEKYMPVYALSRLLYAHPCTWQEQPKSLLRAILKWLDQPETLLRSIPSLQEACAERLRKGQPLPYVGCGMLSAWLQKVESGDIE